MRTQIAQDLVELGRGERGTGQHLRGRGPRLPARLRHQRDRAVREPPSGADAIDITVTAGQTARFLWPALGSRNPQRSIARLGSAPQEAHALAAHGVRVAVVVPDRTARRAMGRNMVDDSRRPDAARAGHAQAAVVAGAVAEVWNG
ncbi:hypothetical protein [Streptomyces sp. MS1.AVA.4]|uniref:Uncharacterized protein n=1 Tax=Streptomyces pratisoli TaxID=3139917 RepID=A0ACC6QUS4_9ACTN